MQKPKLVLAALACLVFTSACSSSPSTSKSGYVGAEVPPTSAFAKVSPGMGMKQVQDLIGPPTDSDGAVTGKAFNPFYIGTDHYRTRSYYKGEGYLVFSARARLLEIHYDPDATGYR